MYFRLYIGDERIFFEARSEKEARYKALRKINSYRKNICVEDLNIELFFVKDYEVTTGQMWYGEGYTDDQWRKIEL